MKKYILAALIFISANTFGQFSYKLGLLAPLPIDMQVNCKPEIRSVMAEASLKISKKFDLTMMAGHLVFSYPNGINGSFKSIPFTPGLKYKTSKVYFGTNLGPSFWSENINDYDILWSPYVGAQTGKISFDLRYFNWRKVSNSANTLGIVVSYNL